MKKSKTFKCALALIVCAALVFGGVHLAGFVGLDLPSFGELFSRKKSR